MQLEMIAGETREELARRVAAAWDELERTNALSKAFDESQHPRDYHGRFAAGEGGSDLEVVVNSLKNKMDVALEKSGLTNAQKTEYRAGYDKVLDAMTDGAILAFRGNVKDAKFFDSPERVTRGVIDDKQKLPAGVRGMVGAFVPSTHTLYLDGGGDSAAGHVDPADVYAHEFSHALDTDGQKIALTMSGAPEWKDAWSREIVGKGPPPITKYAQKNVKEGWAEFGRLVLTKPEEAVKFPACYKVWKDRGYV